MASIHPDDVLLILKLLDQSSFDELHLEDGDFRLHIQKRPTEKSLRVSSPSREEGVPMVSTRPPSSEALSAKTPDQSFKTQEPASLAAKPTLISEVPAGLLAIKAPVLGTFYRSPKPGAPPFVEVGSWVEEDDPVGIIEVMKLFNTIRAGVRGRIAEVCAEQGQLVEFQQPLFFVEKGPKEKELPKGSRA